MHIGNIQIKGKVGLAPMAGVTDRTFREICSNFGCAFFTSEMVSVKGLIYNSKKTFSLLSFSALERPFAIQLFGNHPEDFKAAVKLIEPLSPDMIDINMGCPAPKIVNNHSGSALLKSPELCAEIVYAVKSTTNIPVTIKIRSGWDEFSICAPKVAILCEKAGASAVTVHGRTREQMYSGKASLDIIKSVKQAISIPTIGNGDVTSPESAEFMLEYTGCDLIAVGRGALGNPWIFSQINSWLNDRVYLKPPTIHEKIDVMIDHVTKICKFKGEHIGIKEARKHIAWYLKGIHGSANLRNKVYGISSIKDLKNLCDTIISKENLYY